MQRFLTGIGAKLWWLFQCLWRKAGEYGWNLPLLDYNKSTLGWMRPKNASTSWVWPFHTVICFMVNLIRPPNFRRFHLHGRSLSWKISKLCGTRKNWPSMAILNNDLLCNTVHHPPTPQISGWKLKSFQECLHKGKYAGYTWCTNYKVWCCVKRHEDLKRQNREENTIIEYSKIPRAWQSTPKTPKKLAETILEPLEKMFNLSLQSSKMPEEWKIGEISAIFKKGNRRSPMNYRPVSLTSIVCKLLESLVREEIISHMRSNKLFSSYQYGFIDKRSTTLQLLYVLDKWTEIIDDGGTIDAIYMDFMKAFDKVPHERLLKKVEAYGIGGPLLGWIRSFLTGRVRVRVDEDSSKWTQVTSRIPQGSVLGLTLFVLYINDLPDSIQNNSTAVIFADDTKLFARTDTSKDKKKLQEDLDCVCKWSSLWLLKFHPDKCKVLSLGYNLD